MIEWINNTVTLKDLICESLPGGKDSGIKQLLVLYVLREYYTIICCLHLTSV